MSEEVSKDDILSINLDAVAQTLALGIEDAKKRNLKVDAVRGAIGLVDILGRRYQVQLVMESIKENHVGRTEIKGGDVTITKDFREYYEPVPEVKEETSGTHTPAKMEVIKGKPETDKSE